jgi:L-threonylcarbamoyladenylate synthase
VSRPSSAPDAAVAAASGALEAGEVVAIPTDTVYGLAALLAQPAAVERLAALKGRPAAMPIAVLVADRAQAEEIAVLGAGALALVDEHWPGALTIVVDARDDVARAVGSIDGSVGVRCPDDDLVRALAARVGPLATTSANLHGQPTPETATGVAEAFPDVVLVDGGRRAGTPSTVVDVRSNPPVVLRQGGLQIS